MVKRLIKSEPLGPGEKSPKSSLMKLKKRSSRCGWSLRNQGEKKGDKGRKCRIKRKKRIFYLDPRRPMKKKKCNRMVTVHTQTRRKGIKLGLTFETRWNVIQEIRLLSPSQIELNLSSFRSGYSFSFSLFLI